MGINRHIMKTVFMCLSEPTPKLKKKVLKEIMHFHYMTFIAKPWHKTPCPGGYGTYNFSKLFIGHHLQYT